ncbi:MAG: HEAT repeat domain-containing protein [Cyanobacteriota bacterium]|nr:HEAT repeat domain-containing protein [Cyanobacteriota bacterium]
MNPSLLGVVAFALAAGLWLAGRRPKPLLKSTDSQGVAALNRVQNSLVREARQQLQDGPTAQGSPRGGHGLWSPQVNLGARPEARMPAQQRQAWLKELKRHYQAGGAQRLEAMRLARTWGEREVLPLLLQGLRDPDPRVMREAALAMESFRGRPSRPTPRRQALVLPRNVARTR